MTDKNIISYVAIIINIIIIEVAFYMLGIMPDKQIELINIILIQIFIMLLNSTLILFDIEVADY